MKEHSTPKVSGYIRIAIVVLALLLQLSFIFLLLELLRQNAVWGYWIVEIASVVGIFSIAINKYDSAFTIAWMLVIMVLPIFGYVLFLLWGRSGTGRNPMHQKVNESIAYGKQYGGSDDDASDRLHMKYPHKKQVYGHLERKGFGVFGNTACEYFPVGELQFDAMIADMENAKESIFMCYFILNTGKLWDRVFDVLVKKAAEGVEVRLMYDDIGSIFTAPDYLLENLRSKGIQAVRFSPVHKFISSLLINYRNHQKITVIDGNIGYTGGTNLADEYANYYAKHGHWKDNAIRMEGEGVWGLTVIFLEMWDSQTGIFSDYTRYRPTVSIESEGWFLPFADGPNNNPDNPAEAAYRSMIATASDYLYVTTPYLVIDETMRDLLCTAAAAGVDVAIITPYIWDHWYVKSVSKANYKPLLKSGVKIYEYLPGFIHAKTIISDNEHCIVGSINMDYRSFHLHYENGVWMCDAKVIEDIKHDMDVTIAQCIEVKLENLGDIPWYRRLLGNVLRLFEVLM